MTRPTHGPAKNKKQKKYLEKKKSDHFGLKERPSFRRKWHFLTKNGHLYRDIRKYIYIYVPNVACLLRRTFGG